jgi:hypothetical protein
VDVFPLDSWLLVTIWRMLRRNPRRFSQRLKLRKIRRKCSRNPKRKIQKRWRWRKSHWSSRNCTMALYWRLMLMGIL